MRLLPGIRQLAPLLDLRRIARATLTRDIPVYAHLGITHRCNLTCRMCGIWRYGNKNEEMSLEQIRELAPRLRRLGVVQLAIGGGEPFMRDDLEQAASAFVESGLTLRILTNGVEVSRERLEACVAAGVRGFAVSLDSLYPARFDTICERPGSWESAVQTICTIAELLKGQKNLSTLNCVVSRLNLEELSDLVFFAKAMGFAISFLPVELLSDPADGARNWEARFVRYQPDMALPQDIQSRERVAERVDRAYDGLISLKRRGLPILNSFDYLEASRNYLKTGRFPREACDAGRLYFSVAPSGQYTICHRTQHQHGHILDPGFEEYFRSVAYERLRLREVASCEGCMRACWIDTSYMFRTLPALLDAGRLTLHRRTRSPLSYEQARTWARYASRGE